MLRELTREEAEQLWPILVASGSAFPVMNPGPNRRRCPTDHRYAWVEGDRGVAGLRILAAVPCGIVSVLGGSLSPPFLSEASARIRQTFDAYPELIRLDAATVAEDALRNTCLQELGFEQEGVLREHLKSDSGFMDVAVWGLLRSSVTEQPVRRNKPCLTWTVFPRSISIRT